MTDAFDARLALRASGPLRAFNDAGVLAAADVHVARRLAAIGQEDDDAVALAAAFAVRGPRLGHVFVDLATIRDSATVDAEEPVDLSALPWPDPDEWVRRVRAGGLVAVGEDGDGGAQPLRLVGSRLYLDRYWREERQIAADLRARAESRPPALAGHGLSGRLARLFPHPADDRQRLAAAAAALGGVTVIAGGPGTGKTTTVARLVALLAELGDSPLVALAAPTAKAAARLGEAVHEEADRLDVDERIREALRALDASTLHRLLGWRPDSHSRFKHDRGNRLPHDVVVVDETSMVPLSQMARLLEAVRPDACLVLVGDPGQLTSIEAGAVLGDIVGPAASGLRMRPAARAALAAATGEAVEAADAPASAAVADGIVVLDRVHRYGAGIGDVAAAIRAGNGDAAVAALEGSPEDVTWVRADPSQDPEAAGAVRAHAVDVARAVRAAAEAGDAAGAIRALGRFRLLCAHRRGDHGVSAWTAQIESWLTDAIPGFGARDRWYVGQPLLVTANDYGLRLYNGDTGVVVATAAGHVRAAFERRRDVIEISPARLGAVETVYAMTVHKSQGSQFDTVAVVLPPDDSPILTRELLYTAVTRARERLILVGPEDTVRAAVARPVARASGLRERLWGPQTA